MEAVQAEWSAYGGRLAAAAGSVVGNHYHENYDVLHLDSAYPLAVVADGMGRGPGSTLAGRTAVDAFVREVRSIVGADAPAAPGTLRDAVTRVQREVTEVGRLLSGLTGCTLTAFLTDPYGGPAAERCRESAADRDATGDAWIVQLGDSRVYRLRRGLLELLTIDHTVAWLGVTHGWFAADSPEAHRARYRLTRYVGHPDQPESDLLHVGLRPGDMFLVCTDGVADQVSYHDLGTILGTAGDPPDAVQAILDATLQAGGADNATAVVVSVGENQ